MVQATPTTRRRPFQVQVSKHVIIWEHKSELSIVARDNMGAQIRTEYCST